MIGRNFRVIICALATNFLCLFFICFGILAAPKGYRKSQKFSLENRLMIQTIVSSLLVLLFCVQSFIPMFTETNDYYVASYIIYLLHFYPPMFYIFLVTPVIRNEMLKFYFSWFRKLGSPGNSSTSAIVFVT